MKYWKKINGFNYHVSSDGDVMSLRTGNVLKPYVANGYLKVDLYINSIRKKLYVHQLVCLYFNAESNFYGAIVNHKDGNKKNNKHTNLEWVTFSQNEKHSYDVLGRIPVAHKKGADSFAAKKIVQLDISGNKIAEYGSIIDAQYKYGGCIERCLSNRNKTAYGYLWKYKNDYEALNTTT